MGIQALSQESVFPASKEKNYKHSNIHLRVLYHSTVRVVHFELERIIRERIDVDYPDAIGELERDLLLFDRIVGEYQQIWIVKQVVRIAEALRKARSQVGVRQYDVGEFIIEILFGGLLSKQNVLLHRVKVVSGEERDVSIVHVEVARV